MSKRKKEERKRPPNTTATMDIGAIISQLDDLAANSRSFITGKPEDEESDAVWKADIEACDQATAILSALQDEGIGDPEQVKDLIADYNALAHQSQAATLKYEIGEAALKIGTDTYCPECKRQIRGQPYHCSSCGKKIKWR